MGYKRGDIVLVNFNPQKKKDEVGKVRPAIIMSDTELNDVLDLVSVIALTTNLIEDSEPLRIRITKREDLNVDSDAMVEQLRFVSKERIKQRVACVSDEEIEKVGYGVGVMLGLLAY
ncbi:MAG: PemK family transcriptional regulator [Sulfurovum sp.]|nr:MAG: PemK family transcriptional regulator [Sulfurovum sp.]